MNLFKDENLVIKIKFAGVVTLVCAIIFALGFSVGYKYQPVRQAVIQPNYSTFQAQSPNKKEENVKKSSECKIKGNISGQRKTYHVTGGAFYDRTQEEICFNSEEEAANAGFVKSSR